MKEGRCFFQLLLIFKGGGVFICPTSTSVFIETSETWESLFAVSRGDNSWGINGAESKSNSSFVLPFASLKTLIKFMRVWGKGSARWWPQEQVRQEGKPLDKRFVSLGTFYDCHIAIPFQLTLMLSRTIKPRIRAVVWNGLAVPSSSTRADQGLWSTRPNTAPQ